MTDRELLTLAAKAAGIALVPHTWDKGSPWGEHEGFTVAGEGPNEWSPLESSEEAFWLATTLRMRVHHDGSCATAELPTGQKYCWTVAAVAQDNNYCHATRRDWEADAVSDPLHPKTAAEAAEAFMRNVPADDPKMPEPVALMDAAELRELTTCNSMRVQCGNPPVYDEITAKAEGLVPVITTEAAQAYAEALAAARVAQERERCARLCELWNLTAPERLAVEIRKQPPETGKEG